MESASRVERALGFFANNVAAGVQAVYGNSFVFSRFSVIKMQIILYHKENTNKAILLR
jgi:hypothetical protein